jgi:hypothetical protein
VIFAPLLVALGAGLSFWFANRGLPIPDEGAILTNAAKILRGAVFYREIDAYPFPGATYCLAWFMKLFGEHLSVARGLAAFLYCAMLLSLYLASLPLLGRRRAALFGLSLLSFKLIGAPGFTSYMYSDLSFCFACFAIALLVYHPFKGASIRLVAAGACVGVSILSKQNLGIYLAAAAVALLAFSETLTGSPRRRWRQRWSELAAFTLGVAVITLPFVGYFAAQGLLSNMFYSGIVRPFTGYLPTSGISFVHMLKWWNLGEYQNAHMAAQNYFPLRYWILLMKELLPGPSWYPAYWMAGEVFSRALYTSVPLAFVLAFARWLRTVRRGAVSPDDRVLLLLAVLSLAVTASAFPRADIFHVTSVYPLVLLLLFGLKRTAAHEPSSAPVRRFLTLEAAGVALLLGISAALSFLNHSNMTYRMKLDRADVYEFPDSGWVAPMVKAISEQVAPHEQIFVYGHEAHFYFLTGRFFSWPFAQLYAGQTGGDRGETIARLLEAEPPNMILMGILHWPGIAPIESYAPILSKYVKFNFQPDRRFFRRHPPPTDGVPRISILLPENRVDGKEPSGSN